MRHERRQKRGGAGPGGTDVAPEEASLIQILSREPTPEFAAQMAEEYQQLLEVLGDPELRSIAVYKMEGDTTDQIAAKLTRAPRTIERRLQLIRKLWEKELAV